jgi:hypothetical protein
MLEGEIVESAKKFRFKYRLGVINGHQTIPALRPLMGHCAKSESSQVRTLKVADHLLATITTNCSKLGFLVGDRLGKRRLTRTQGGDQQQEWHRPAFGS